MCSPQLAAYAAVSLIGARMQADAQEEAADRQQRAINDALEQQDRYTRQAEAQAMANANEYGMDTRLARLNEARTSAGRSLAQHLTQAREAAPTIERAAGRMSQDYMADSAERAADQFAKSLEMATLMGNMQGAGNMLTNESLANADHAAQLAQISRNARGAYGAAQPGINAAGRMNSGQMALGAGLQTIGMSGLGEGLQSGLGKGMDSLTGNLGTAIRYNTIPFREQTRMLARQDSGLF